MRFNFVGKIGCNAETSKVPYYKKIEGYDGHSLNLICIAANNNRSFLEIAGFKNDTVKYYDNDGKEHEVEWSSRLDEDVVKSSRSKNVISLLDGTRKEFISAYDFVQFVNENIDKVKDKRFVITGACKKNVYKGKITDRFNIQNMFEIEEEDTRKNQLRVSGDFFFDKGSVDLTDWKKEKKIYLNGWTQDYIDKEHPNAYVAKQVIVDCHKADLDNEQHFARVNFQLKQIGLAIDEDKEIVSKLKKGKHYKIGINLAYSNGAPEVEFDVSQLTDNQKMMLELQLVTLDELRPKNAIYGERRVSYYYKSFDIRGEYADGMILVDEDDFDDMIYTPMENESFEKAMNKPVEEEKPKKKVVEEDDGSDELFGDD